PSPFLPPWPPPLPSAPPLPFPDAPPSPAEEPSAVLPLPGTPRTLPRKPAELPGSRKRPVGTAAAAGVTTPVCSPPAGVLGWRRASSSGGARRGEPARRPGRLSPSPSSKRAPEKP
ncbi:unnamed protein product, partial [Ectocarpus sp. 12 AP-2014]